MAEPVNLEIEKLKRDNAQMKARMADVGRLHDELLQRTRDLNTFFGALLHAHGGGKAYRITVPVEQLEIMQNVTVERFQADGMLSIIIWPGPPPEPSAPRGPRPVA